MGVEALSSALQFRDATRAQAKACILIEGLSGSGKSGLALLLGYYLSNKDWQKVYGVDTENRSLDLYEGVRMSTGELCTPFRKVDLLPMHGYAPSNYNLCKASAIKAGAKAFINDSITHMWQMHGGILQRVSELEAKNRSVNKFSAWGTPEIAQEKNAIYEVTRDANIHVISTVRIKEKHEMVTVEGKTKIQSLGEQEIFMPDFKYEPDLVLRMVKAGTALGEPPVAEVIKSRYVPLVAGETYAFTESLIGQLVAYLNEGADPELLQEQQRQDYILAITEVLDKDVSKRTMFPILKEQQGVKDLALQDIPLAKVKTLLGVLIN